MNITEIDFRRLVGRNPANDDLERVNCSQAGEIGHLSCGMCRHDKPYFNCMICTAERISQGTS